jgi:plasmid maintenance system antidote protein VapI
MLLGYGGEDVDSEKQAEFMRMYVRANEAANALHTQAKEVYEMAKKVEELTKDTTIRYATLRVKVEARAAFEQAMDLREAFEQMGKQMRGES